MYEETMTEKDLRQQILQLTKEFYTEKYTSTKFEAGKSRVNYAGRVFDEHEIVNLVDSSLDFWLTEGRYSEAFSEKIADYLNVENVILTNSGSSANLLAFSALTSKKLGIKQLKAGDEVISVAAGFPVTVTPIIQNQLVPVFVDVHIPTYNIDVEMMKQAITDKTKAIFIAHTLGNPFDINAVMKLAQEYDLWVIEDNCDAFGSTYNNKYTGTFGHISTISFYPAHHITTGEGGAVCTDNPLLASLIRSFRDWGRDCYCGPGENNTCGKRFSQQFGTLPPGYDHKYVYSEIGYNLKMTDMQAAIGSAQMEKLPEFCDRRRENFQRYNDMFSKYESHFILPEATSHSDPAWFSYIVTVRDSSPFSRDEIVNYLNQNLIETRNLFAGNMTRQPAFLDTEFRVADHLKNTDLIVESTFFLGTFPGNTTKKLDYIEVILDKFMSEMFGKNQGKPE
jgi:CDP-4-dehydro-6-deoxyglucose reductase, E1